MTQDSDHLRIHAQGERHAGIVYFPQHTFKVGQAVRSLALLWEVLTQEEMQNQLEYLLKLND